MYPACLVGTRAVALMEVFLTAAVNFSLMKMGPKRAQEPQWVAPTARPGYRKSRLKASRRYNVVMTMLVVIFFEKFFLARHGTRIFLATVTGCSLSTGAFPAR